MAGNLPSGTVTFLFTDVVGSTRLWEHHPDLMRGALAHHDRILRDAIGSHSGHVFSTAGDAFSAAFGRATDAVRAAVTAQLALTELGAGSLPVSVRMGVHTGVADERGGDYFGPTLNRTARLMSVGHGGQILVSDVAAALLDADFHVLDLGEHLLRGLPEPLRIYQVVAEGLALDHPPLISLGSGGNLPRQLTSFIGRSDEKARLNALIGEHRLVTLIGVGGTGKTRLALQTGAELSTGYRDGVWLIELGPVNSETGCFEQFMAALGVRPAAGVPNMQRLVDALLASQMLLIVDNCEHVLGSAARIVDQIMQQAPAVQVLATSREPLLVSGEQIMGVPSLDVTGGESTDAVALFIDRCSSEGREIDPDEDLGTVAEICQRLDGLPLAIELAASRARSMPLADLRDRLNERFRLLKGGRRQTAERHQTLRATVDWSYRLLDEPERLVFDRLGVFAGPFSSSDATAVCAHGQLDEFDVIDALASLVDKSMCVVAVDGHRDRYRLLETLRSYAQERLEQRNQLESSRRAHANHFRNLSLETNEALFGPGELVAAERYAAVTSDMRAAVTWAAHAHETQLLEGFIPTMSNIGWRGKLEPQGWLGELEDLLPRTPVILGALVHEALFNRGDPERAQRLAHEALELPNNQAALYSAHRILGLCSMLAGDIEQAIVRFRLERQAGLQSPAWYEPLLCGFLLGMTLPVLGLGAEGLPEEMLKMGQERDWPSGRAFGHYLIGRELEIDDPTAAAESYRRAAAIGQEIGNESAWAWATRELLLIEAQYSEPAQVGPRLSRVLRTQLSNGGTIDTLVSLCSAVILFARVGNYSLVATLTGHIDHRTNPLNPSVRVAYDAAIADAAKATGPRWNEYTDRGRHLSTREAVDLASAGLSAL